MWFYYMESYRKVCDVLHLDSVYWCEARCDEGGRSVVCRADLGAKDYQSLTPKGYNSRTTVHEYGNGSFSVHGGVVYFSNFDDQCLYTQTGSDAPVQLTEDKNHRYANGFVCEKVKVTINTRKMGSPQIHSITYYIWIFYYLFFHIFNLHHRMVCCTLFEKITHLLPKKLSTPLL